LFAQSHAHQIVVNAKLCQQGALLSFSTLHEGVGRFDSCDQGQGHNEQSNQDFDQGESAVLEA
jgi:hypothetical protein